MHKKISKAIAGSLMSMAMLATAVTGTIAPLSASAGQVLGETSFTNKALPWHTCETSPAKQDFRLEDEAFHITVKVPEGGEKSKWDLQFRHRNLNFKAGHEYEVSFKVKAKRSGMELCSKIGDISGNDEYFSLKDGQFVMGISMGGDWGNAVKLTTEYQTFSGTFKPTKDLEAAEWTFHYAKDSNGYGGNAQEGDELWFDDMSIICKTCGDGGECDADPNKSYGATNRDYGATFTDEIAEYMTVDGKSVNFVSVNQIGYYPNLAKVAVLGDNQGDVLPNATKITLSGTYGFDVCDAATGEVKWSGTSTAPQKDGDSADSVCKLDFSEFNVPGRYYIKIQGQDWRSFEFNIGDNIYYDESHNLLTNAMNYFYQNRSGIDIEDEYCTSGGSDGKGTGMGHKGGHKTDTASIQKIWKNEYASKEEATSTYKSGTLTANGGWYDAGDHGKYVVNGGISIWTLQNMYERAIKTEEGKAKFADGSGTVVVPEAGNGVPDVLDEAAVELDWIAQMKVTSSDTAWGKYEGLYYHKLHDHKWTGLATRPWDYDKPTMDNGQKGWGTTRIVKPPTFAATLNYAACAGQAARLWQDYDGTKAETYLKTAVEAFKAYKEYYYPYDDTKTTHPTLNCECPKEEIREDSLYAPMWQAKGGGPYGDNNVLDDAYWAACEIYLSAKAMGDDATASKFKAIMDESEYAYTCNTAMVGGENKDGSFTSFNWGNTASAGTLSLALHEDMLDASEFTKVQSNIKKAADDYIAQEEKQGYGIPYKAPAEAYNDPNNLDPSVMIKGYEWGSNSMVINNSIVMAYAYDIDNDIKYMNGVSKALDYLFGTNPLSFSFVTGYGTYVEKNPHHRYWSYELDKTLPMAPDGILSGGPNAGLQDPYVRALAFVPGDPDNPSQRCFVDSIEAWSTNEVTINWNAPLAWIASFMQDEAADASGTPGPKPTDPTDPSTPSGDTLWGDANCDGQVTIADSTAILQALGNPDKYGLSAQGAINADVIDNGDGVKTSDALAIQAVDAKLIKQAQFPMSQAEYDAAAK
ncbi:MAG: glycoside hydrolase family 9 protein [Ruminococcus sp.]|nr:glycoside hydrolase family 9 protein [Ruminococcus sp.]